MPITNDVFTFIRPRGDGTYELFTPTLYVPIGSKAVYQATDGWKRFSNIVEGTIDASAIDDVTTDAPHRMAYTLSGQRLAAPKKGINIVGGRKVVVK